MQNIFLASKRNLSKTKSYIIFSKDYQNSNVIVLILFQGV